MDTPSADLSWVECPLNVSAGIPVQLEWESDYAPVNVTLWSLASPETHVVGLIANNITDGSYTWTPSTSLSDGIYQLLLSSGNGSRVNSELVTLDHNKNDSSTSISSTITTSSTSVTPSTIGPSSTSDLVTATPTLPNNPASATTISEPPAIQQSPTAHHTINNGGIAAIAVGAALFILLILASAIICCCRRRRRRSPRNTIPELPRNHQADADVKSDPSATIWIPELGPEGAVYGPHELPGTPPPLDDALLLDEETETKPAGGERAVEIG